MKKVLFMSLFWVLEALVFSIVYSVLMPFLIILVIGEAVLERDIMVIWKAIKEFTIEMTKEVKTSWAEIKELVNEGGES